MKLCAYHLDRGHPWERVLQFFAASLTTVERGTPWQQLNFNDLATSMLTYAPGFGLTSNQRKSKEPVYRNVFNKNKDSVQTKDIDTGSQLPTHYCLPYQQGTCKKHGKHNGFVSGRPTLVDHFCSFCITSGERLKHPKILCQKFRNSIGVE